jgi:uncharacterized protein YjaZ
MKRKIKTILCLTFFVPILNIHCQNVEKSSKYILYKENSRIILAYKAFEDYLNSEKSWENYQKFLLDRFPEMLYLHRRNIEYNFIDSVGFRKDVLNFSKDSFKIFFDRVNDTLINEIYETIILKCNNQLPPLNQVDLCFYLPYGDCFMINNEGKQTIFISLKYSINKIPLILCHEYAHCLHYQRRPEETECLKRKIITEGIASYLPIVLFENSSIHDGLWMMSNEAIDWCTDHEQDIKDSIMIELNDGGLNTVKRYIAGGAGFATPPKGFPEKIGYYVGYRIIQSCINKGIPLSEICSLNAQTVINRSGYFK